jgi:methylase of polypeptide subunit release factors
VLDLAGSGAGRRALDLGGGAGVETQAILGRGWEVLAIDYDPEAADFA